MAVLYDEASIKVCESVAGNMNFARFASGLHSICDCHCIRLEIS